MAKSSGSLGGGRARLAGPGVLVLPAAALIVLFFALPVVALLLRSVLEPEPGLGNYEALLGSGTYLKIFSNTFLVSAVVTAISVAVGFPVAWALAIMPPHRAVPLRPGHRGDTPIHDQTGNPP